MPAVRVSIGRRRFSLEKLLSDVPETSGACVVFVGIVRGREEKKRVEKLEYTAYTEMARTELRRICVAIAEKFGVDAIYVHHRIGTLRPKEPTVYIAVFGPHRNESFMACREVLELIKQRIPVWKKEFVEGENGRWK
ncbi:MAG: molybdenum cofactor biosynthesis protein MoaE [Thermoplasmata archaeon]|nr:molybdenum cofactor biosynthesis protein MoaE [Thermoplasmata archaeon]